jgi:hypothetical protein
LPLSRRSHGERSEISIRGYEDSTLDGSEIEDRIVVGVLPSHRANVDCIMTGLLQKSRALAKERCRSGTSFAGGEGQRSFAHGFGRKQQRLADVVRFEVWVQREDGLCYLPFSYEGNDSRDWNPKTAKTWNSTHLAGIDRDPLELHIDNVARRPMFWKRAPLQPCSSRTNRVPSAQQTASDLFTASPDEFERLGLCC